MFRRCSARFTRQLRTSRIIPWQIPVPAARLCRQYGTSEEVPTGTSPTVSNSVEFYQAAAPNHPNALSSLGNGLDGPDNVAHQVQSPAFEPAPPHFFIRLSQLLENEDLSGSTLWNFVYKSYRPPVAGKEYIFTLWQQSLLSHVLRRVLDEWTTEGVTMASIRPFQVLRFYTRQKFMRYLDWVYCLNFLAKTAYQNINLHKQEPLGSVLNERMHDAIRLRILCKFWRLFLVEGDPHKEDGGNRATHEQIWPELRKTPAQTSNVRNGEDYVQQFKNSIPNHHTIGSADLDRQLAYTSVLTLVVLYHSLRTFYLDNLDAAGETGDTLFQSALSTSEEKVLSRSQPNWHLGPEQSTWWTPEIGHLSVSEASILYMVAQTAENSNLNLTLLRITLAQFSLHESDTQEIAGIYQGFKNAVPAILESLQGFSYDENVYRAGMLRRYPLRAYVEQAVKSNDSRAIDNVESIADSCGGASNVSAGDAQALLKAFLRTGHPKRALRYWSLLAQAGKFSQQGWAWQVWLDYAFEKKDLFAFETAWNKLGIHGTRRSLTMWHQRLLLLHQNNQPMAAWDNFCTLVRFSGNNKMLKGPHRLGIAPRTLTVATFHLMIQAYLEPTIFQGIAMEKAKKTLELLKQQQGLRATRSTYILFIQHFLARDARQSAVDWFGEGRQSGVKFLPQDYALLFEFDLTRRQEDGRRPLADSSADIRDCFNAIAHTMCFIGGSRLFNSSTTQRPPWSSKHENTPNGISLVDHVAGDLADPKLREIQSLYAGIMQHLSHNFADRPSDGAKTARLRLLLLLWDHCVGSGIPASTEMDSVLRSTIHSLHLELQEKLIRGAMFKNYNIQDSITFHSYRYLRLIGPEWLAERVESIVSGPTKSQLANMPWNGYAALDDELLIDAGVTSQDDRIRILDQIKAWKENAIRRRTEAAEKKKERRRVIADRQRETEKHGGHEDMIQDLRLAEERQARAIENKEQRLKFLLKKREEIQAEKQMERRLIFDILGSAETIESETGSAALLQVRNRSRRSLPRFRALRPNHRATRKRSLRDATNDLQNTGRRGTLLERP
jgi:hypothetical protein